MPSPESAALVRLFDTAPSLSIDELRNVKCECCQNAVGKHPVSLSSKCHPESGIVFAFWHDTFVFACKECGASIFKIDLVGAK